jgi:predicted aspartyl protease
MGLIALSCASPEPRVEVMSASEIREIPWLGSPNAEERLARGEYLEVEAAIRKMPRAELEKSATSLATLGRVFLARGDIDRALPLLTRAIDLEARPARRAELEWALAQGFIFWDEPELALEFASAARRDGYGLLPGYIHFLEAIQNVPLYTGPEAGESHETDFSMQGFDLIRVPVKINGADSAAIVDTGAAYTILTQSFAKQVGVREIPDSKAFGRGLHAKEFPLTFGVVDRLEFGGFTLAHVPVMLMPDDALLFETSRGEFPVPMVLGLHLIKQFRLGLDYGKRHMQLTRVDPRGGDRDPEQNLFVARSRLFVRTSIDKSGWYQLLFDTGSEPTMLTSNGVRRAGLKASNKFYPKKLYGIGQSEAAWARVDSVVIGLSGFGIKFRSLPIKEDDGALEDGILGNSVFKNFLVTVDFKRMRIDLQQP